MSKSDKLTKKQKKLHATVEHINNSLRAAATQQDIGAMYQVLWGLVCDALPLFVLGFTDDKYRLEVRNATALQNARTGMALSSCAIKMDIAKHLMALRNIHLHPWIRAHRSVAEFGSSISDERIAMYDYMTRINEAVGYALIRLGYERSTDA